MAIGIFKSLIFGDVNSADYGIYITGEAVYNAPERAVEMVTVPGRNGAIALDQGRWENIEVSYPAGCFGGDQSDFASKISEFRNAIVSQIGYQRLTDEYNPNEYRMAVYAEGLDVKPKNKGRAGEFTITFDCKPQRYLTSGETEITVESGDTLTNPTQYESSPLLMTDGYGTMSFNGYDVTINDTPLGDIIVNAAGTAEASIRTMLPSGVKAEYQLTTEYNNYNLGDDITYGSVTANMFCVLRSSNNPVVKVESLTSGINVSYTLNADGGANYTITCRLNGGSVTTGQSSTISSITGTIRITRSSGSTDIGMTYSLNTAKSAFTNDQILTMLVEFDSSLGLNDASFSYDNVMVNSSVRAFGGDVYIDCDLGEAYRIDSSGYTSLNKYIVLGSDLPTLAPGENEITFDNTITELKIVPRWWKL